MATDFKTSALPVIDISPLLLKCDDSDMAKDVGVAEVVGKLDRACRDIGFFYVVGHEISEGLMKKVKEMTHRFFQLPLEEKLKIKITPAAGYRGYQRMGINFTNGKQDMLEAIDCYREFKQGMYGDTGKIMEGSNQWPENPQEYKDLMEEYIRLCKDLSRNIVRGISLALGGSPYEFEGEMAGDPFWFMRINGYPGVNNENDIGCGAHTDYGLLSLINQDDDKTALQVRNLAGEWIPAIPIPGSFVCNIGDMLKILSNGVYESTLHRVINSSARYRVCVAFFYETNFDTMVEPLDIFKDKHPRDEGSQDFKKVVYGEHLVNKVHITFPKVVYETGQHVTSSSIRLPKTSTPLQAECLGFLNALQAIWRLGYTNVLFESDCLDLVRLINRSEDHIQLVHLRYDLWFWMTKLPLCSLSHVSRTANSLADRLSRKALSLSSDVETYDF